MIKERKGLQSNEKNSTISEFIEEIKNKGGLKQFDLGELIKPNGYAHKISKNLKFKRVQLRKIFTELKNVYKMYKNIKDKKDKEVNEKKQIMARLYKLYPILQYQVNRDVIDNDFKVLMWVILDYLEKDLENFDNAMEFIEALVAYLRGE